MSRISSFAANAALIERFLQTQQSLNDYQTQVSTGKKSQTYAGIAAASQNLVNTENTSSSLQQFIDNNNTANLRLNVQTTAVNSIQKDISNFQQSLVDFSSGDTTDPQRIADLQDNAFRSLKDIETLLNTEADGRFVFGGSQTHIAPANLNLTSLSDFQSTYNGSTVTVPTTRDATLAQFTINKDSSTLSPSYLTFEQTGANGVSRIDSTSAQFQNIAVGSTIDVSGTVGSANDGKYTVKAVDPNGKWIDVQTTQLTTEATPVAVTLTYPDTIDPRTTDTINTTATFNRDTNTLTATDGTDLSNLPVGSAFTISGSVSNDGTYTVKSNDGTNVVIDSTRLADAGGTASTVHTAGAVNTLTFSNATGANGEDQLIAATAGTYSSLRAGQKLLIEGTNTENDGKVVTVKSVSSDGTTVTLNSDENVDTSTPTVTAGTVTTQPALFSFDASARNFYFDAGVVGADDVTFTDNGANADTITLSGGSFTDAKGNPLAAGAKIAVTGTTSNNGTYTVASLSSDGKTATLVPTDTLTNETNTGAVLAGTGSLTFTHNASAADTVTLGGGFFRDADGSDFPAGTTFTVAGTGTANDGKTFTIASVSSDGRTATLVSSDTATTGSATVGTLDTAHTIGTVSADNYYNGDTISPTQRVSDTASFSFDLNAIDPSFEKAIRAMELVMQGKTGSSGGLDQNSDRVGQALYLLNSSLSNTNTSPPPFGEEKASNLETVSVKLGYDQVLINNVNNFNTTLKGYLDSSSADAENSNNLDAITNLLNLQQTLQASYQSFATVRQLSLGNYL